MKRLLTPEEVAETLNVTPRSVLIWLRAGELKGVKVGRLWRISEQALEEYLARGYATIVKQCNQSGAPGEEPAS